jgi:acetyl-CoA synthetase/medium-chain acyl-CoA synthetase
MVQGQDAFDYEQERRMFRLDVPDDFNWAYDVVDAWAANPQQQALFWIDQHGRERAITFAELRRRSNQVANALEQLGVNAGDRVFIMLPRLVEWWETVLGCIKLGAVVMPGTTQLTTKDILYRLRVADVRVAVTDAAGAERFEQACREYPDLAIRLVVADERPGWTSFADTVAAADPERARRPTPAGDPCMIYFTSGTVGYPKMVLHSHSSAPLGHTITGKYWLDLKPGDLHWNLSDTGWAKAAWSSLFGPWNMGATIFVQDARGKFSPGDTLDLLERYPINSLCAPPTIYRLLVQEDLQARTFPALRSCTSAGEPLNPEVIDVWQQATGITIRDGYGQTESVLLCGNFPGMPVKAGSMGRAAPGFDLAVVDDAGQVLPAGKEGDLAVRIKPERPVGLFQEYWRNPDATAATRRGDWYITGDRAFVDEDGYFWFVGRADDVILSAGYRIGPFEVESALIEHPAVAEAAVVASPDELRGDIVKAFVILAPGSDASEELVGELQEHVKYATAPYKYPREIEFVDELPKTVSGKIRRVELREREKHRQ